MYEPTLTLTGNLTADPELRYTASGTPVANFTVAATPKRKNPSNGSWEDGETLFLRCAAWRDEAQNIAASLSKGARVVVTGALRQRSYEKDGEKRTTFELDVDEVAASLKFAQVEVRKIDRTHEDRAPIDRAATLTAVSA